MSNKFIIAAAGSGKTTFLVKEALAKKDGKVLITTFTQANEAEIKKKFIELNKFVPGHVTIQTWFSFLLQHGAKPYQGGFYDQDVRGLVLVNEPSARYVNESEVGTHYFTRDRQIYSDKLAKFVVRSNENQTGAVIDRISRVYTHIFVDEVQDMAGYDLEILKLLFQSNAAILLVGDPRQVTYQTHHERKYVQYAEGKIKEFILQECPKDICEIDEGTLNKSFRNNEIICAFSSMLYPSFAKCPSAQEEKTDHDGIFLVKPDEVAKYLETYKPMQLRNDRGKEVNVGYAVMNFGESKGLTFERVLIYPTGPIAKYLKDGKLTKQVTETKNGQKKVIETRAFDIPKFYVAVTRAKFSVGIVLDYKSGDYIEGIQKFPEPAAT